MFGNLLFVLGGILLFVAYVRIFICYLINRKEFVDDVNGFDVTKEILSNYDEINIVESKEVFLSQYKLKRGVIRLNSNNYEGNNIFCFSIVSQLAGYSLGSMEKDYYFGYFKKIFPTIDWLNKSGIVATLICGFTNTIGDAKIGLFLLILVLIYQYFILQMNTVSIDKVEDYLNKSNMKKVRKCLDVFHFLHKVSFIGTLIYILREIVLILGL